MTTPDEFAQIASPLAVVVGMIFTAYWSSRKRNEDAVKRNAERDARENSIATELKTVTEAASLADEHLAESIGKLGERLEQAIVEFKISNERHAKHEVDCAEFRGATLTTLKELAAAATISSTVRERLAVQDERLKRFDDYIDASGRRFEELFRGQSVLAQGRSAVSKDAT